MPNRQQPQDQQQKGRRNPMQTSPDDDEAQVEDQTQLQNDDEADRDEGTDGLPTNSKRRALQPSQEREEERMAQGEEDDESTDDDSDEDDIDDDDDEDVDTKGNLSGM